jgi:polysaccharide chain length determinant protein (PEP-CTERM system associated)
MKQYERNQGGPMDQKNLMLQDYIEIFWRRKWWFVLPVVVGTAIAIVYSYSLPPLYRSSTLILVQPQQVPESYVRPTVTSSIENRLNTISQQILSRTNLQKIIKEFGLYKQERVATSGLEKIAARIGAKVKELLMPLGLYHQEESASWNPMDLVDRMRKAIEINVLGGRRKSAFTVAYSGSDPRTVMEVTNALASLFIEENLKVRERQAEGTSEFLAAELAAAEKELRTIEGRLKEFKEQHRGALPEQLEANLRTLDRLQLELQTTNETLRNLEERRVLYEQQLSRAEDESVPDAASQPKPDPREMELAGLKRELARLQAQFNDNYPDIIILKKRINEIESQRAAKGSAEESSGESSGQTSKPESPRLSQLQMQLRAVNSDIQSLKKRQKRISFLIKDYERRIEETYDNQLKIFDLERDYGISKRNYERLLEKKLNAKMSENLEKRQKGEQFKVLDPANLPIRPYKPDRPKIILLGSFLGGSIGFGLILLLEYLNQYFRKPEDFQGNVNVPVLVTIPSNSITQKNKDGQLVSIEEPDSIATEQYRVLYAKLHDLYKEKGHRVFAISSSMQGEGKTVTALNLAVVMARDFGKKTLLLEGDFKAPAIARYLKAELESGLVDILLSRTDLQSTLIPFADVLIPFADDNLSVLPAVKSVRNSSGLLSSQRMKDLLGTLKGQYDFILIDAPPVLPLSDMQVFEEVVDSIILLVRAEKTPRDALLKAVHALGTAKLAGVVLNDVQQPLPGTYRYAQAKA